MNEVLQRKDWNAFHFKYHFAPKVITGSRLILACNYAFKQLSGYEQDDLIGCSTLGLYTSEADLLTVGERTLNYLRGDDAD